MLMTNYYPQAGKQRGMSLVELMIGMLLGLILLGGVILVFTSSSEVNRNRMAMSAISDNARFTLEHMNRHLRMADPGSIEFDGDTLTALLTTGTGDRVTYTLDTEDDGVITFESGHGEEMLVDGINGWQLFFGIGNSSDKTLVYQEGEAELLDKVWSVRVNLMLEDPSNQGNPLVIANNTVGSTIALRNPLLLAIADRDPLPPPTNSGSEPPSDSETPVGDGGNADGDGYDDTPPSSEDDGQTETEPSFPTVACEVDKDVDVHQKADFISWEFTDGAGTVISCSSNSGQKSCKGRVFGDGEKPFTAQLTFKLPNGSFSNVPATFKCD